MQYELSAVAVQMTKKKNNYMYSTLSLKTKRLQTLRPLNAALFAPEVFFSLCVVIVSEVSMK